MFDIDDTPAPAPREKKPALATVYDIEGNWTKLMEEFKKDNSMIAGYYAGVNVKTGDPTVSPFALDVIFPKSLKASFEFANRDPRNRDRLQIFLEDVLGKTIVLNIYYDDTIENNFSLDLANAGKIPQQIFEDDLKDDATFKLLNDIFKLEYQSSRQKSKKIEFDDKSRAEEFALDPDED